MGSTSEAIAKFNEYASVLGHPVQNQVEGFVDIHGRETYTHHFKALNGVSYLAQIAPNSEYGLITSHYNILVDIQGQLPDSELDELANSEHGYREHEEEDISRIGARALLLHCDDEDLTNAKKSLHEVLENPDTVYRLETTEREDAPYHVFAHQRVFPYYDSFTPDRFSEAVRMVTHYRQQASKVFHEEVDLPIEEESFSGENVENDPGIVRDQGFQ